MPVSQGVQVCIAESQHGTLTPSLHGIQGKPLAYSQFRGALIVDGGGALHALVNCIVMTHFNPTTGLPGAGKHRNRHVERSGKYGEF